MIAPRATVRLQLHQGYTFEDARSDLAYFGRLGVSHLYLSPVTQACRGSTHGYDVVDYNRVSTALGGEDALRRLASDAHKAGMGLLLDIVPNHMASDPENAWWRDVLANGRNSRWADWFDIDWDAPRLRGRVLAPFLDKPYGDALVSGDIRLAHDASTGLFLSVHGAAYPLAPETVPAGDPVAVIAAHDPAAHDGRERLHALLERQHYRLAWWRCAAEIINWRRFFEVAGLIGVRVEKDEVFDAVHGLVLRLYAEGVVDGLRVDHVDGLARPLAYCRRLYDAMAKAAGQRPASPGTAEPWIVVEKILASSETLDERWQVSGTTGYDFASDAAGLLHDGEGAACLIAGWKQIAGDDRRPEEWLVQVRRRMLDRHFVAEREALLDVLVRIAQAKVTTRDWTRPAIGRALDALLCHFPVYRTYVEGGSRTSTDQAWFDRALRGARVLVQHDDGLHAETLDLLDLWLGNDGPAIGDAGADLRTAVRRFQQLTPPLAAKSLEDTVFYRYGCLLSRNEVGSSPEVFSLTVEEFHRSNIRRAAGRQQGLLATATHDHKRGEDVRARLAIISEMPGDWLHACRSWLDADAASAEGDVDMAFRYMLLQTIVGAWPPDLSADDREGVRQYFGRLGEWTVKALREGKQWSSWFSPDLACEEACLRHLWRLSPGGPAHPVLRQIEAFVRRIEPGAIANGIVQAALRITCPGVPDLYQGTEFRDFSLVDPDNRRPVDFALRADALAASCSDVRPVLAPERWTGLHWRDGRVKQAIIAALLQLRARRPAAFASGYRPLAVEGDRVRHLVAYARGDDVIVLAGVKCAAWVREGEGQSPVLPADFWGGTTVALPFESGRWQDVLRGQTVQPHSARLRAADLMAGFPLAVLCRNQG